MATVIKRLLDMFAHDTCLLASSCLSAHISESSTEQTSMKFGIANVYEHLSRNSKFGYNWAKYWALCMKT